MSIAKHTITELQMEMIKRLSSAAMRRGWTLQQSGRVRLTESRSDFVQGLVQGKEQFQVRLDLGSFVKSSCTCAHKSYCLHMAALFFELYGQYEKRTELFLMQHQQMRLQMQQERKKKQAASKKPQLAAWQQEQDDVSEQSSFAEWQVDFEKKYAGYFTSATQQVTSFHAEADKYIRRISDSWRRPVRETYRAFAQLFMLSLAEGRYLSHATNYQPAVMKGSFMQLFQDCVDGFRDNIQALPFELLLTDYAELLDEALNYVHKQAFARTHSTRLWLDSYRYLLWKLADDTPSLLPRVKEKLERRKEEGARSEEQRVRLELAWQHMLMVTGEGSNVDHTDMLGLLLRQGELSQAFTYVSYFAQTKRWGTLKHWLSAMLESVRKSKNKRFTKQYLYYWNELNAHHDVTTDRLEALRKLLPHSFAELGSELLKRKQYGEWMKLQMAAESSPLTLNRSLLREIEAQGDHLLVPFFHQAIDRYVQEKKRESYQQAVLLLKQLRLYYERQGESERFAHYLQHLITKYSVLRAFREELGRSNLLL